MGNSVAPDHFQGRQENDPEIEKKRALAQIVFVQGNLLWDRQFVAAVDLCPAGQTRQQSVDAALYAQGYEVVLIEKGRARADDAHLPFEDAPELRQFVEAGFAQEGADRRQIDLGVLQQMGRDRRRVGAHAAKFRHAEDLVFAADPIRPIEDRAARRQPHGEGDDQDRNEKDDGRGKSGEKVEKALGDRIKHRLL